MKTIAAIATPLLTAPVHIIRVSGPLTFKIINKIVAKPLEIKGYTIQHNQIRDEDVVIDDVLLNIFVSPKSFTGEDIIEINCHGSVLITKQILNLLIKNGCELAQPGEFSMQALMNKKMNYYQIEAMNNFIHAKNSTASKIALRSMLGKDLEVLKSLRHEIFKITGSIEVNIDYPEYDDVPQYTHQGMIALITPILHRLQTLYTYSKKISPVFLGLNVAIIGKPNVGKSSLMNLLAKREVAIVSDIKGTTRDVIKSEISFNGLTINLLDTAGLHHTRGKVENLGIAKTNEAINAADLIIWLLDGNDVNTDDDKIAKLLEKKQFIKVFNKSDLAKKPLKGINISVKQQQIEPLLDALERHLQLLQSIPSQELVLQSDRQIELLGKIIEILTSVVTKLGEDVMLDLLQASFEECIILFDKITGNELEYDKLDELFANFCLGK